MKIIHNHPSQFQLGDYAVWSPTKEIVVVIEIETAPYGFIAKVRNVINRSCFYTHLSQLDTSPLFNTKLWKVLYDE